MIATVVLATALTLQSPTSPAAMFAKANAARAAMGSPPFVRDERLAGCAREAVANNWDSHEFFYAGRAAKYGAANEISIPGVYGLSTIFQMMQSHPRMSRGLHARYFRDPRHRRIGMAYGGRGPTSDNGPFFVMVFGY